MTASPSTCAGRRRQDDHRIVRGVAQDRVISTVDPDSEIIAAVTATPGDTSDRDAVEELLAEPGADPDEAKPEVVGD